MARDAPPSGLCAEVRRHCAAVAASARWVRIDTAAPTQAGGVVGLDGELHFLEAPAEDVARYILVLDAINFGSGWFPTLRAHGGPVTAAITRRLTRHARRRGTPWTAASCARSTRQTWRTSWTKTRPRHELMRLYAEALNQLGTWLGDRTALEVIGQPQLGPPGAAADLLRRATRARRGGVALSVTVRSYLGAGDESSLGDDVLDGLTRPFKELPPKHFYDQAGAELFDRICELPEYYPMRAERAILTERSGDVAALTGAAEVVENVQSGARVITDGWSSYPAATRELYEHEPTTVLTSGQEAHEVLPAVHTVFSLIKRWVTGTLQGSVSPQHLQAYFDDWVFRFNRRRSRSRGLLFHRLIAQAANGDVVTYQDLRKAGRPGTAAPARRAVPAGEP